MKDKASKAKARIKGFRCVCCHKPVTRTVYGGNRWVISELLDDPEAMAGLRAQGVKEPSDPICDACLF